MAIIVVWRILSNVAWTGDTRFVRYILVVGLVEWNEADSRLSRPCVQLDPAVTKEGLVGQTK